MLDPKAMQAHAEKCADEAQEKTACPFDLNTPMAERWLDFYYARVMWLSGELTA